MNKIEKLADDIDTIILSNPWTRHDAVSEITSLVRTVTDEANADRDAALELITFFANGSVDEAMLATLAKKSKALLAHAEAVAEPRADHGFHVGDIVTPELTNLSTDQNYVVVHPDSMTTYGDRYRTLPVRVSTAGESRWVDPELVTLALGSVAQADAERKNAFSLNNVRVNELTDELRRAVSEGDRLGAVPWGVPLSREQLDVLYPDHLSLFVRPAPPVQF